MDQDGITELINKSEVTSIVNRYFRALDEKNFDAQLFASMLTPQARVTRPNGAALIGPDEISASHEKSFTRFEGSQHFVAGHDISFDGSTYVARQQHRREQAGQLFYRGRSSTRDADAVGRPVENLANEQCCPLACRRLQGHDADRHTNARIGSSITNVRSRAAGQARMGPGQHLVAPA